MIARGAILFMFAVIILLALAYSRPVHAGERYPTVRELEAGIGYAPGAPLKELLINGRRVLIVYVGARTLGRGMYDVRIKLR